ncbi:LysR family transcriptional regulator [Streptomyces sp. RPA4-5]|uniref:LysR family transcriptional regulator n=1 Tax=Streptomyces sp. RPA4-5 TaxID=2721245 RepID=UPI00143E9C0F|nr:LysR family transcriptional regulator [Streptomyces sp. RPA4-5]QIY53512.1 LysR family transcriptional regulator [Streptomyces sp. RPA4-5]
MAPHLAIVVAVLEEGHITRAAKRLDMPQPTVSRALQRVERELDVALVQQNGRGITVTEAGRALLGPAAQALAALKTARSELADAVDPERGRVALAFLHTLGAWDVPLLIDAFRASWPEVRFSLAQGPAATILDRLRSGETDVVITAPLPADDDTLGTLPLREEELFLTVPTGHRFARLQQVDLRQAAQEPFVALTTGHGLREIFDGLCTDAGFVPRLEFLGEDVATLRGLVGTGQGLAVLPAGVSAGPDSVQIPMRHPVARRTIGAAWLRQRRLPRVVRHFLEFLHTSGAQVLAEGPTLTPGPA